jgi:hypothetical protein
MSTSALVPFPHRLQDAEYAVVARERLKYGYATGSGYAMSFWLDHQRPKPLPTNCKNCGAPLRSVECDYCNTKYHR